MVKLKCSACSFKYLP